MNYRQFIMDVQLPEDVESEMLIRVLNKVMGLAKCKILTPLALVDSHDMSDYYLETQVDCEKPTRIKLSGNMVEVPIKPTGLTTEWCFNCDSDVELKNEFVMQECPSCKEQLKPCSICETRVCSFCPFDRYRHDFLMDSLIEGTGLSIESVLKDIRRVHNLESSQSDCMAMVCEALEVEFGTKEQMYDWLVCCGIEGFGG